VVGIDPQLTDPENGDYRPVANSPATGYGCQTFPDFYKQTLKHNYAENRQILYNELKKSNAAENQKDLLEVNGIIAVDTVWEADTIRVTGNIVIEDGVTLTIMPGTIIEVTDFYSIEVYGSIQAEGLPDERIVFTSSHPELFNNNETISGCWAGITFNHPLSSTNETSFFKYCAFQYAKAVGEDKFGGVMSIKGMFGLLIENCLFQHNLAEYGGAIYSDCYANFRLTGNVFTDNYALIAGSVMFLLDSYPKVINNTFAENIMLNEDFYYDTAAIHNFVAKPLIKNNIFWNNNTYYFEPLQIRQGKSFYISYNDIQGGYAGKGNIDADPVFTASNLYNYELGENSPCIDRCEPDGPGYELPPFDFAGNSRVTDGDDDDIQIVDIGAFEYILDTGTEENTIASYNQQLSIYPNPFNISEDRKSGLTIRFSLLEKANVIVSLYDIRGRKITTSDIGIREKGENLYRWENNDLFRKLTSGLYLMRIKSDTKFLTGKLMIIK